MTQNVCCPNCGGNPVVVCECQERAMRAADPFAGQYVRVKLTNSIGRVVGADRSRMGRPPEYLVAVGYHGHLFLLGNPRWHCLYVPPAGLVLIPPERVNDDLKKSCDAVERAMRDWTPPILTLFPAEGLNNVAGDCHNQPVDVG